MCKDHGVLLVGFGIEEKTNWRHWHPRPYWKIKNSWGPNWGEGTILYIFPIHQHSLIE